MDIDPRKRKYQIVASPWYVHPFEVTDRGVPALLPFYDRGASEASRAEFFADVLFALYGDYFRHGPRMEGRRLVWYCPAADQKDNAIEGELDANNAVEWVEVPDAANTMSDYLSSGDFYRVCADTARDLELNAAGMAPDHAQVELRRAANVLTSFSDLSTDDSLYAALKRHLRERDSRWLRNGVAGPGTPSSSPAAAPAKTADGAGKENACAKTEAWRTFKSSWSSPTPLAKTNFRRRAKRCAAPDQLRAHLSLAGFVSLRFGPRPRSAADAERPPRPRAFALYEQPRAFSIVTRYDFVVVHTTTTLRYPAALSPARSATGPSGARRRKPARAPCPPLARFRAAATRFRCRRP